MAMDRKRINTWKLFLLVLLIGVCALSHAHAGKHRLTGLKPVKQEDWTRLHVQRVLQAFAYGGQASEQQLDQWASMAPGKAIQQILNFKPVNTRLSPHGKGQPWQWRCRSLLEMQELWSSDKPNNPLRADSRPYYATLDVNQANVSLFHLALAWSRAVHTPGCNGFIHKTALYLTNYHAAVHAQNAGPVLMRAYYDDVLKALSQRKDFVELMTLAASHAALSVAYGHAESRFDAYGQFLGNDDFAREYFQLLFGIQGVTEDPAYHEGVTIENNAKLLTGMMPDVEENAWGSDNVFDWLQSPINFSNHRDPIGRWVANRSWHYDFGAGDNSCLEILNSQICGRNAQVKLNKLGPVAASHPESMASTPLKLVRFFGDDQVDADEAAALQSAWADAELDILTFLRAYAISTLFHAPGTRKLRSTFDRNLMLHNANQLSNEEAWSESVWEGPLLRMYEEGALVFAPIRDVFGHQTGTDAANDRYLFKHAWDSNVEEYWFLAKAEESYQLRPKDGEQVWQKNWGATVPVDSQGRHIADDVSLWLWNRFIGDGGRHYDALARAQILSILVSGRDFALLLDSDNPDRVYTAEDLEQGAAADALNVLANAELDLTSTWGNWKTGLAVNFITALPYSFAMEVAP